MVTIYPNFKAIHNISLEILWTQGIICNTIISNIKELLRPLKLSHSHQKLISLRLKFKCNLENWAKAPKVDMSEIRSTVWNSVHTKCKMQYFQTLNAVSTQICGPFYKLLEPLHGCDGPHMRVSVQPNRHNRHLMHIGCSMAFTHDFCVVY